MRESLNKLNITTSGLNSEQITAYYNYFVSIGKITAVQKQV